MKTIIRFEIRKWVRSKIVWFTAILWLVMVAFSLQQRATTIHRIKAAMDSSVVYELKKEKSYYSLLDSAELKLKNFDKYDADPRNPVYFNRLLPRFAIFKAGPLNHFATGQSDLFPQQYTVTARADFRQKKEEAVNALQLLYGKLDIAFIITFLLPLIIIAFNYHVLSSEKENGTLKLLLIQNTSLRTIIFAKLLVSVLFSFLLLFIPAILILFWQNDSTSILAPLGLFLLAGLSYSVFWHFLIAFINGQLKSSAFNATVLMGCWLFFTLVYPTLVNLLTETFHPVPSRSKFVIAYRQTLNKLAKEDENNWLDKFFFDHPELVKEDTTGNLKNRSNQFYKAYHLEAAKTEEKLAPLYGEHADKLSKANQFSYNLGIVSPAILMQNSVLLLAGQSSRHYLDFNQQVSQWRESYLAFILQRLLQDKEVSKSETLRWKAFDYHNQRYLPTIALNIIVLFLFTIILSFLIKISLKKAEVL